MFKLITEKVPFTFRVIKYDILYHISPRYTGSRLGFRYQPLNNWVIFSSNSVLGAVTVNAIFQYGIGPIQQFLPCSVLLILMAWWFISMASAATVLITHPCVSSWLRVNIKKTQCGTMIPSRTHWSSFFLIVQCMVFVVIVVAFSLRLLLTLWLYVLLSPFTILWHVFFFWQSINSISDVALSPYFVAKVLHWITIMDNCPVCNKRVLSRAIQMDYQICKLTYHMKCISLVPDDHIYL